MARYVLSSQQYNTPTLPATVNASIPLTLLSQPYVTELDLRHSLIPDELVEDLISSMPSHKGPDLQEDRHLPKYDYVSFMEKMTLGDGGDGSGKMNGHGAL